MLEGVKMAPSITVLGISGSLRAGSFNTALLRAAQELAPQGMVIDIYDLSPIPLYNADLEQEGGPEAVGHFKEAIRAADALLFAVPEYNYSIPGVLKNAIDWASRPAQSSPLSGKPIAMMGAGGRFGTVRAQLHFSQIALFANMFALNKPELMIPMAWEKFDGQGRLTDGATREQLGGLLAALGAWTNQLKPRPNT
jgi:chromate reductase, NAD(P)H dehydrogenase (quinone)